MMAQQYASRQRTARPTLHTSRSEGLQERRGYTRQEILTSVESLPLIFIFLQEEEEEEEES